MENKQVNRAILASIDELHHLQPPPVTDQNFPSKDLRFLPLQTSIYIIVLLGCKSYMLNSRAPNPKMPLQNPAAFEESEILTYMFIWNTTPPWYHNPYSKAAVYFANSTF